MHGKSQSQFKEQENQNVFNYFVIYLSCVFLNCTVTLTLFNSTPWFMNMVVCHIERTTLVNLALQE